MWLVHEQAILQLEDFLKDSLRNPYGKQGPTSSYKLAGLPEAGRLAWMWRQDPFPSLDRLVPQSFFFFKAFYFVYFV